MSGIINRILIALVFILVNFGSGYIFGTYRSHERYERASERQAQEAKEITDKLQKQISDLDRQKTEENENARKKIDSLRTRIANGSLRLSVPANCTVPNSTDSTGMGNGVARAYIDGTIANRLIGITDRGDQAIRQLQFCQETLDKIRQEYVK